MDAEGVSRRLAASLSADAVGYSRLMAADEVVTIRTLRARRQELPGLVGSRRGPVVAALLSDAVADFAVKQSGAV